MKFGVFTRGLFLALIGAVCIGGQAAAHTFPSKPIRIVASTPPGGTIDLVARILAQHLPKALGQPVIVENKVGAAGNIAAEFVARSPADGHTLLVVASSHATNISLYPKMSYHPLSSFAPVSLLTTNAFIVTVPANSPAKTFGKFLATAKQAESVISYGSSGSGQGNHLGMELLKVMANFDALHVPFRGSAPVTLALLGRQVDVAIQSPSSVIPYLKDGQLKALATTGKTRLPFLPDVPTVAEAGVPGYELLGWIGLLAPAGTPPEIVNLLQSEAKKILNRSEVIGQLQAVSTDVVASTPTEFSKFLESEIAMWAQVIQKSGAKPE